MKKLEQKRWPHYRIFQIEETGIRVEIKDQNNYSSRLVPFEQVGTEEVITRHRPDPYAIGLFISAFFNILVVVIYIIERYKVNTGITSGLTAGIAVAYSVWSYQLFKFEKQKYLQGQEVALPFYYFKKEQGKVDKFIGEIKEEKKRYFREKFIKIDKNSDLDSLLFTFKWLLDEGYISKNEYNELIEDIRQRKLIDK